MRCERCTGLVVADHFVGGGDSVAGWTYCGWRCVNCGAIGSCGKAEAQPVIRSTRRHRLKRVCGYVDKKE
jgi:hypothetical protein